MTDPKRTHRSTGVRATLAFNRRGQPRATVVVALDPDSQRDGVEYPLPFEAAVELHHQLGVMIERLSRVMDRLTPGAPGDDRDN